MYIVVTKKDNAGLWYAVLPDNMSGIVNTGCADSMQLGMLIRQSALTPLNFSINSNFEVIEDL